MLPTSTALSVLAVLAVSASASPVSPRSGPIETATDVPCLSSWQGPPNGPGVEEITSQWPSVPFKKLGGFSPWFDADGVYGIPKSTLPEGCKVDQVQLYMRHGMREASGGTHKGILALVKKLQTATYEVTDDQLQFVKTWNWTQPPELLTPLGEAGAYANGMAFLREYQHLFPQNAYFNWTGAPQIPVRSTDQERVNATAQAFTRGMLGEDMPFRTKWLVTPDSLTTFNSTVASNNCPAADTINFQNNSIFNANYQPAIVKRLSAKLPGFNLTATDVSEMMNACPFDSFQLQRPSPWCSIFTAEEWEGYNYAYDLNQFDNAGYGGPIGAAWGVGWVAEMIARLNNSAVVPVGSVNTTLDANPETFPLNSSVYLDFGHDTGLESIITAMNLLPASYDGHISLSQIDPNRAWQSALISPMAGRLHVQRYQCSSSASQPGTFVRFLLNNAVVPLQPLPECANDGYAYAGLCKLDAFLQSQTYALNGANFPNCANNYTGVTL